MQELLTSTPKSPHAIENLFVELILQRCEQEGIKVWFAKGEHDEDGRAGYWTAHDATLCVYTDNEDWFAILLHEYAHVCQFLEGARWDWGDESSYWILAELHEGCTVIPEDVLRDMYQEIALCELDADRRVLEFITQWEFPSIDVKEYISVANLYSQGYIARYILNDAFHIGPVAIPEAYNIVRSDRLLTEDELLNPSDEFLDLCYENCHTKRAADFAC